MATSGRCDRDDPGLGAASIPPPADAAVPRHGWLIVDKPIGLTSADVVARIKRLARASGWGKGKVGHGGTLDPLATGVLPIALGEATKLAGRMLDATKAYRFTVAFGAATATDDAEGAVVATSGVRPTLAALEAALPGFTGPIVQRPPAYSALKVDGRRAYERARAGETVVLVERRVEVLALAITASAACTDIGIDAVTLEMMCSKGTYVRSLARDLAAALGTVGHVTMLRRTRAGPFGEAAAWSLDRLAELAHGCDLEQALKPLTAALDDIPAIAVSPDEASALRAGRVLAGRSEPPGLYLALDGAVPVALVEPGSDGVRVVRGFNLMPKE